MSKDKAELSLEALEKRVAELEAQRAKDRKVLEDFMAEFGHYYNSGGQRSLFIIDRLVRGGANGIALTSQQGAIELFALPMRLKKREVGEPDEGPYWIPALIPEQTEEAIEAFAMDGGTVGANNQAIA